MDKLLLIDGNSLTYRAYFGSAFGPQGILTTSNGTPVNAVLTLYRMINKAINQYKPTKILIAFDAGSKTKRHEKLKTYKGGRSKTPDELIQQFPIVKEMITLMGIKHHEIPLIEADDIIATLAKRHNDKAHVTVHSSDKDLLQLVDENIDISLPQNRGAPNIIVTIKNFFDKYGYTPEQVKDIKGIVGDPSDNLPGVKGIGEKGAIKLINEYGTLENIYENIDKYTESVSNKLKTSKDIAYLCKELATLEFDIQLPYSYEDLDFKNVISEELNEFFRKYELNSLVIEDVKTIENKTEKSTSYNNIEM
ncbi:MAG: hypothetical protein KAG14_01195 [Mycoplasmataceae bacterium]|nr:hypothetical protein [Mycoplasmataceae bacterium]